MKILVTGSEGFIGKNLIAELKTKDSFSVFCCDVTTDLNSLRNYCQNCEFVFHLAGINRPVEEKEFMEGNHGFTHTLTSLLKEANNFCPIMISSSTQAELNNPYGKSKKAGEQLLLEYGSATGAKVLIYRFPNVFGKWGKPNYNSVVATFCYNISRGLPIKVNDSNAELSLVYVGDVVNELMSCLKGEESRENGFCRVEPVYHLKVGEIASFLYSIRESRENLSIIDMQSGFLKKLYATYLSYLPEDKFSYDLKMNVDARGSFTEFVKTEERGQVSINISKPGIVKGNHWHHTKTEKFLVVKGEGVVRFRKIGEVKVFEYYVSDKKLEVIDIPPGYTHNIENLGTQDMVTVMWANEKFDPDRPDTYFEQV